MKEPRKFPGVLTGVMVFISILFTSIGILSYAAFGSKVETVIILNLPSDSPTVQAVQLLYALAIVLSIPLQLFPAIRIMEQGLFQKSGKVDMLVKWQKNLFRTATVLVCGLIAWNSEDDLDKFVSLIGSFAW
jgi:solute carrier family 36 (proton-coupled amino acid transporter)